MASVAGGAYAQADAGHEHYRRLLDRGLPVVLVNAAINDLGFPTVATDDAHAVEQATPRLARAGVHRAGSRPARPCSVRPSVGKLAAVKRALFLAGAVSDEPSTGGHIERTIFSFEGGHAAASRPIKRGVSGLICASDVLGLGAIRAVRRMGLRVPDYVSVVGLRRLSVHDLHRNAVDHDQPIEAIGQAVVALLVSEIAGNAVRPEELVFEPELVVRGSTGAGPSKPAGSVPPKGRHSVLA